MWFRPYQPIWITWIHFYLSCNFMLIDATNVGKNLIKSYFETALCQRNTSTNDQFLCIETDFDGQKNRKHTNLNWIEMLCNQFVSVVSKITVRMRLKWRAKSATLKVFVQIEFWWNMSHRRWFKWHFIVCCDIYDCRLPEWADGIRLSPT